MGELVDDVEHGVFACIMGALLDKVVRPDVVAALCPKPDARSVVQPKTSAFGLAGGNLQPLAAPDPLDPFVVDPPSGPAQQLGDAIAIATVLPRQFDDVGSQPGFILTAPRDLALRRSVLAERRAGTALGNRQRSSYMLDARAATRGA